MNRREFIESSLASTLFAAGPSWAAETTHKIDRVGLQLYTVRDLMKKDFVGTIAQVARIGYKEVEFAGYYGHTPQEVRSILKENGLSAPSTHVEYSVIEKQWQETLDTAKTIGLSFVVCPWIDQSKRNPDGMKQVAELFNRAGETAQKSGIQLAYHNHAYEFEPSETLGNKKLYDVLLAETDPKLVKMEMDLCWITVGGADPLQYFEQNPGRFPLVHVKDWTKKDGPSEHDFGGATGSHAEGHMADVGQGDIDWKRIFAHSDQAGIQHYIVENDYPKSPYDDLRVCYEYLAKLRF
jgi:sugar phosphate isomerase/epimerase